MKTEELRFALRLAQPCIVSVDLIPVLQHFCFEEQRLFAYDEVSAIVVKMETGLRCALRADTLLKLVELAGPRIELAAGKDGKVTLTTGKTTADLPSLPPEEFTFEEPRKRDKSTFSFALTQEFVEALSLCSSGVSKDPRFKTQTAVALVTGSDPRLYAYDGTSLVMASLPESLGEQERAVLVPQSICDQIQGIMRALSCKPEDVTVNLSKNHLSVDFESEDWEVYLVGKLLEEEADVTPYEHAIKEAAGGKKPFELPEEFSAAVDKVSVVVANEIERKCVLKTQGEDLVVRGEGSLGVAETVLEGGPGGKVKAEVDPERLSRYRDRLTHMVMAEDRIAMYDAAKTPSLVYVVACYT